MKYTNLNNLSPGCRDHSIRSSNTAYYQAELESLDLFRSVLKVGDSNLIGYPNLEISIGKSGIRNKSILRPVPQPGIDDDISFIECRHIITKCPTDRVITGSRLVLINAICI